MHKIYVLLFLSKKWGKKGLLFHSVINTQLFCSKNWYPYLLGLFQYKRRWKVVILDQTSALEYPKKRTLLLSENDSIMKFSFFLKKRKKDCWVSLGKKCLQGKTQKWLKRKGSQKYHCENILKPLKEVVIALCSRNFQNVKLRLHFVEISKFPSHSD